MHNEAARSESCGPHRLCVEMVLLYLDATEVALAFDIEGLEAVRLQGVAVAVYAGEGGVDLVLYANVFIDTDFHAAEAAVDVDDGTIDDVGMTQVEADKTEAGVHISTFEGLTIIAIFLLAEAHVNLVHLAAVHDNGLCLVGGVAMAATSLFAEAQQRNAPYHGHKANHVFPYIGPKDDITCRQKQQDADAETYNGPRFVLVVEDVDEAWHNDEECPPAFKADMNNIHEL